MKQLVISGKLTNRTTESFDRYLKEISTIKLFTPEEEKLCSERASRGDKDAINELVRRNLRFVISVAKQYTTPQNPLEDLVNEGNIGLMLAAEKFKPEMGFKFISYAVWWVRKVIMEYMSKNGRLVRIPANKLNDVSKLDKKITELEHKFGGNISIEEILDQIDYNSESKYDKLHNDRQIFNFVKNYHVDSMDRSIDDEDKNGINLYETISDDSISNILDHNLINQDIKNQINSVLNTLKPRDKQIMIGLFGLDGNYPKTLNDMANEIGITREMIRQVKIKSLNKLSKKLKENIIN